MNKSKAGGVSWVKPAEPTFLQKFKKDVGYKEGPTVDTKRHAAPTPDDDGGSDREDELPQVVVLEDGDLTSEEVKHLKGGAQAKEGLEKSKTLPLLPDDEPPPARGKILFKKPAKRSSSDRFQGITASSRKKKCDAVEGEDREKGNSGKKVKNNSLLSFGCDDEEED